MITHLFLLLLCENRVKYKLHVVSASFHKDNDVVLAHKEAISYIFFHISFDNSPTWGATQAEVSEFSFFFIILTVSTCGYFESF